MAAGVRAGFWTIKDLIERATALMASVLCQDCDFLDIPYSL